MKKNITLHNRDVAYSIRRSGRAMSVRLAVYSSGDIVVTAPRHIPEFILKQFIAQKAQWILQRLDECVRTPTVDEQAGELPDMPTLKAQALKLVWRKIAKFNKNSEFAFNRIWIKNQKTCWGSCSRDKNLNFNWRIAILPDHLAEYIVVHELCHLKHLNHSKQFWALVESILPNYAQLVKELKSKGIKMS